MAIDATTIDSSAVTRPAPREKASPVIDGGHNGGPVEIQGDMSFWDFLDIINPLQHIPIVSTVYREITGDTIQPSMRIMGGILYGGVIGGMASIANAVIEQSTGKDVGDTVMASFGFGDGDHPATPTAVADASGEAVKAGSPAEPFPKDAPRAAGAVPSAGGLAAALAAARPAAPSEGAATNSPAATGQPVRLSAPATASAPAAAPVAEGSPALAAQLAGGGAVPHPSKMPARDTPLASSALAKHNVPRNAAPLPGSVMAAARAAGAAPANGNSGAPDQPAAVQPANAAPGDAAAASAPVPPDMLSETMMRNLAKYERSRKAAQDAASTTRVSG
ncbi:hypothetical protein A6A40_00220 [Azospirillum humicireducens]|uniref:Uncharacterized protein n=1 Tax=Azospirillum humicireducens TaxID=1226968 RepID=A0A160JCS9_9PROT|nr:hypothetical protein [Azospirillum humicireducens]ANC90462.1 hypothetical protein A6A40_00220 [Azospirillum humicireducens]